MLTKEKKSIIELMEQAFNENNSFVLSGGAGSGKTHSLKEFINKLYVKNPFARIACITYTNVATQEISERCQAHDKNLHISTIHSFLWENIKNYKRQLSDTFIELLEKEKIKKKEDIIESNIKDKEIVYNGIYRKIDEGIIFHDDLLILADAMFTQYPLLNKIFCDKYDYVLIDEYQDTNQYVINIFINIIRNYKEKTKFAFFGDSMQAIYSHGVGNLCKYINEGLIVEIKKENNYRCSQSVIDLCNKIRIDNISQQPSNQDASGKLQNKEGKAYFIYGDNLQSFKNSDEYKKIFENRDPDKTLYLTHNLISQEAGFNTLLRVYKNRSSQDRLIGEGKDELAKKLEQLAEILYYYENQQYADFIQTIQFNKENFTKHECKVQLQTWANKFKDNSLTIDQAIDIMKEIIPVQDDRIDITSTLYKEVKKILFQEVKNLYLYEIEKTPYSTQHSIKGAEFDNVFVILDNGKWKLYNFVKMFEDIDNINKNSSEIILRTLKLFYVCISRTKNNLAVFMDTPSKIVIDKASKLFGKDFVIHI